MKEKTGEYICLYWDTYDVPAEYIRGHVTAKQAIAALKREGIDRGENPTIAHKYGRWEPASESLKADGCDMQLRIYEQPGRGCFAITEVKS